MTMKITRVLIDHLFLRKISRTQSVRGDVAYICTHAHTPGSYNQTIVLRFNLRKKCQLLVCNFGKLSRSVILLRYHNTSLDILKYIDKCKLTNIDIWTMPL